MNVPIRMIGVATTIFWIFIILFGVSAIYSVKDAQFGFGTPQISVTSDNKLLFSEPITIANSGYYNIGGFNATTEIFDERGFLITSGSTNIGVIRKNANVTTYHNVVINVNDVMQRSTSWLFNDGEFRARETVSMKVAEVIPVQASANRSVSWGAPLYDFRLGTPEYSAYNLTHLRVDVPISFENHALFNLTGTVQIRMFTSANVLLGKGQTDIAVMQHSSYDGTVDLYILPLAASPSGYFKVSFTTPFFTYRSLVITYG